MSTSARVSLALVGVPLGALAFALALGLGVLREAPPALATAAAAAAVALPALGLGALFRDRALGALLALPLVALVELIAFPAYFPQERGPALAAGLGTLLAGLGGEPDAAWAARLDALLPAAPDGRSAVGAASLPPARVLPAAAPAAPPPLTLADQASGDRVALPYEGEGRALRIPVALDGRAGRSLERTMIFDTGATYTTLNRQTLRQLGVSVPDDAPRLTFQTAGGDRESPLVLLDRVWIGGLPVDGVTVGVCEPCASDDSVGLLGLNVSRHFLVTVDQARQELLLEPRGGVTDDERDATPDVRPWVTLAATATRFHDGRVEVTIDLDNDAPRALSSATVTVDCGEGWQVPMGPVGAGDSVSRTAALGLGADCPAGYTVSLSHAAW